MICAFHCPFPFSFFLFFPFFVFFFKVEGVKDVRIQLDSKPHTATVVAAVGKTSSSALVNAVECVGFDAKMQESEVVVLEVDGMTCMANCGSTVKGALLQVRIGVHGPIL